MLPSEEAMAMARELLANRETQPVGFYTTVSGRGDVVWQNGAPEDDTAIYTAPPAPTVPDYMLNSPVSLDGLFFAINHLLDIDGSRGCYSAVECHDAREKVERLLAAAPTQVKDNERSDDRPGNHGQQAKRANRGDRCRIF